MAELQERTGRVAKQKRQCVFVHRGKDLMYDIYHGGESLILFVYVRSGLFIRKEWVEGPYRLVKGDYKLAPLIARKEGKEGWESILRCCGHRSSGA